MQRTLTGYSKDGVHVATFTDDSEIDVNGRYDFAQGDTVVARPGMHPHHTSSTVTEGPQHFRRGGSDDRGTVRSGVGSSVAEGRRADVQTDGGAFLGNGSTRLKIKVGPTGHVAVAGGNVIRYTDEPVPVLASVSGVDVQKLRDDAAARREAEKASAQGANRPAPLRETEDATRLTEGTAPQPGWVKVGPFNRRLVSHALKVVHDLLWTLKGPDPSQWVRSVVDAKWMQGEACAYILVQLADPLAAKSLVRVWSRHQPDKAINMMLSKEQ